MKGSSWVAYQTRGSGNHKQLSLVFRRQKENGCKVGKEGVNRERGKDGTLQPQNKALWGRMGRKAKNRCVARNGEAELWNEGFEYIRHRTFIQMELRNGSHRWMRKGMNQCRPSPCTVFCHRRGETDMREVLHTMKKKWSPVQGICLRVSNECYTWLAKRSYLVLVS